MVIKSFLQSIRVHACSDPGLVRPRNEDRWGQLLEQNFVVLADGMGGHRAGHIAAQAAVDRCCELVEEVFGPERCGEWDSQEAIISVLRYVIKEVNKTVYSMGLREPEWKGMGTTLCCLFFQGKDLYYAHIGDSRIYRYRQGQLQQLTRDHTRVRDMIDEGNLDEDEARQSTQRHILTQAVGVGRLIDPSLGISTCQEGDRYLLCTDGLTEHLSNQDIACCLHAFDSDEAVERLVEEAKLRGGNDNVTVVIAEPRS